MSSPSRPIALLASLEYSSARALLRAVTSKLAGTTSTSPPSRRCHAHSIHVSGHEASRVRRQCAKLSNGTVGQVRKFTSAGFGLGTAAGRRTRADRSLDQPAILLCVIEGLAGATASSPLSRRSVQRWAHPRMSRQYQRTSGHALPPSATS